MGPWDEAALESLRYNWGDAYAVSRPDPDTWLAQRLDTRETLRAADPDGLARLILADYTARPVPRSTAPAPLSAHDPGCRCDDCYATLQAEHLAAADLDPDWPADRS
jgi:hypothetical protein